MRYFLAVDIGASSGRHILGCVDNGVMTLEEIYRFPNAPVRKENGIFWDTERLFAEILAGLKKAGEMGKAPESVSVDTWGVDYVLIGKDGKAISEAHSYRDTERWLPAVEAVHNAVPFEELYSVTGIQHQPFNTVYQLWADKCDGKLDAAEDMLMMPEYFQYRLSGVAMHESTNASTTALINTETYTWDKGLIEKLGYPERLFSKPERPGKFVGEFTPEIAEAVGYSAKVVLCPSHDTASAVVGSLADEGDLFLSSGTWSLLGVVETVAHTDDATRKCDFTNEGYADGKFLFLKNITGLWMIQQIRKEEAPDASFGELAELAAQNPTDALVNVNDPRFLSPISMKAEIEAAVGKKLSLGEALYCANASLADGYRVAISDLEGLTGKNYTALNILGGGGKNRLLNALSEKATGKKIVTGPTEATVVGNLTLQMIAAGVISDLSEAKKIIRSSAAKDTI